MLNKINKYKISFLILHYHTIEDTQESVESIIKNCGEIKFENFEIIIVDNGSKNKSGERLEKEYLDNKKIKVIINSENLGFSKGNNIGFKYIKEYCNSDFIVMMNNDIVIIQNDFIPSIIEEYEKSKFAVLGPKILLPDGKKNIHREKLPPIYVYRIENIKLYIKWFINFLDKYQILRNIKNKYVGEKQVKESNKKEIRKENVIVHGSCMIFSKEYIEKFDGLDEKTFLYGEEDLLYIKLIKNNLKSIYNPKLFVLHNEDSSTDAITNNDKRKKIMFVAKYQIIARKVIIKDLKKMKRKM